MAGAPHSSQSFLNLLVWVYLHGDRLPKASAVWQAQTWLLGALAGWVLCVLEKEHRRVDRRCHPTGGRAGRAGGRSIHQSEGGLVFLGTLSGNHWPSSSGPTSAWAGPACLSSFSSSPCVNFLLQPHLAAHISSNEPGCSCLCAFAQAVPSLSLQCCFPPSLPPCASRTGRNVSCSGSGFLRLLTRANYSLGCTSPSTYLYYNTSLQVIFVFPWLSPAEGCELLKGQTALALFQN